MSRLRSHLSYANVISTFCLFVLFGGAAYAATGLGKDSVSSRQLAPNAVTSPKVKDGSLLESDFAPGQLLQGPQGDRGPKGEPGADGSPDTPPQVRDKLQQVDGAGSGIDADTLDGIDSGDFPRVILRATKDFDPSNLIPGACESLPFAPSGVNLKSTDTVIVTPSEIQHFPLQYSSAIRASVGFIYANVCNNGGSTIDDPPITINFLVLR